MSLQTRFQEAVKVHQQGDLARARDAYEAILKQQPRHSEALHLLGVCEFQSGHAEIAIRHINSAIALAPDNAAYHNNLGEILRQCGRLGEAETSFRRALKLAPGQADAHNNLALVLQFRGDLDAALDHLREALRLEPQAPQTAANLGNVLRLGGDLAGACDGYRRALEIAPAFAEARLALCLLLIEQDQIPQAQRAADEGMRIDARDPAAVCARAAVAAALGEFRQSEDLLAALVDLQPQSASVQMTLGRLLLQLGHGREALPWLRQAAMQIPREARLQQLLSQACLELNHLDEAHEAILRALDLEPDNHDFKIQFARICRYQDRPGVAAEALEAVLGDAPGSVPALLELAQVHLLNGDSDQARALLEQALIREPGNHALRDGLASVLLSAGDAESCREQLERIIAEDPERISSYRLLSQSRRFDAADEPVIEALARLLQRRERVPAQAAVGHFALGKMLADCGRHAEAFRHYQQANDLYRQQVEYDAGAHEAMISERIEAYTLERLERLADRGNPSRVPIIIAGMPRSGTTLAERILASHRQVHAGGEVDALTRLTPRPVGGAPAEHFLALALEALDTGTAARLARDYLTRLGRGHPGAARITDKTPQNFLHLGMAAILFPQATIIHCERHPLATCLSIYSMEMNLGNEFGYRFDEMAHYYGQYQRIMRHWQQLLPGRIFTLRYERLVSRFEAVCRELLEFCDLDWDPRCLEFHTTSGTVLTASDWQVRQPLYRGAVDAWRQYEAELMPLRRALEAQGVEVDP